MNKNWIFKDRFRNVLKMKIEKHAAMLKINVEVSDSDWFYLLPTDLILMKAMLGEVIRELRLKYIKLTHTDIGTEKKVSSKDYDLGTVSSKKFAVLRFDDMKHWNNVFFFNLSETILLRRQISDMHTKLVLAKKKKKAV
jgi:hypothetical protein